METPIIEKPKRIVDRRRSVWSKADIELLKSDLPAKEIATKLNMTLIHVYSKRYQLKKKLQSAGQKAAETRKRNKEAGIIASITPRQPISSPKQLNFIVNKILIALSSTCRLWLGYCVTFAVS